MPSDEHLSAGALKFCRLGCIAPFKWPRDGGTVVAVAIGTWISACKQVPQRLEQPVSGTLAAFNATDTTNSSTVAMNR